MENKETKKCPYCGEEILAVAKKCRYCGHWFTDTAVPQQETSDDRQTQIQKPQSSNSSKLPVKAICIVAAIVLAVILCVVCFKANSKTYIKDLQVKTEQVNNYLSNETVEKYTKNGNDYEGEAWEDNDLECIFLSGGTPVEFHFYYPNGQLAVSTQAWALDNNTAHGDYYDSNGKIITFPQFKTEYIDKYGDKLKHIEALTGY